ncbi:hypothetical protein FRC00_004121, partial [Tulasnella sp. 408]
LHRRSPQRTCSSPHLHLTNRPTCLNTSLDRLRLRSLGRRNSRFCHLLPRTLPLPDPLSLPSSPRRLQRITTRSSRLPRRCWTMAKCSRPWPRALRRWRMMDMQVRVHRALRL